MLTALLQRAIRPFNARIMRRGTIPGPSTAALSRGGERVTKGRKNSGDFAGLVIHLLIQSQHCFL
jgi:hypothetical protein